MMEEAHIPLLAEEGAKREPDRAKPQEKLRRAQRRRRRGGQTGENFAAELQLGLRPIGLALRATPPLRGGECPTPLIP